MEKMFYSLEEAAAKLGKSPEQVRDMASKGQLQEFRDRDKLMFKRDQVDLLSGGNDDDVIPLADDSALEPLTAGSATGVPALRDDIKESTGIALVDESLDESDPSAVTRITTSPASLVDPGEGKGGSGSGGLLDLTKEADDTSLGAGLLEDVYGGDTVASQTAAEAPSPSGPLFETPGDAPEAAVAAGAALMVAAEPYNGPWSGLLGGAAVGISLSALTAMAVLIIAFTSTPGGSLLNTIGSNMIAIAGGAAGLTVLAALIGWLALRKS